MSQATLDDDDLFGEAVGELREDVTMGIEDARAALPDADDIWRADADNVLGVLNTLRTGLDIEDARAHLRDAKKWYTVGMRADAFEDAGELGSELESLEETIDLIEELRREVGELASELPGLREELSTPDEAEEAESAQAALDAA